MELPKNLEIALVFGFFLAFHGVRWLRGILTVRDKSKCLIWSAYKLDFDTKIVCLNYDLTANDFVTHSMCGEVRIFCGFDVSLTVWFLNLSSIFKLVLAGEQWWNVDEVDVEKEEWWWNFHWLTYNAGRVRKKVNSGSNKIRLNLQFATWWYPWSSQEYQFYDLGSCIRLWNHINSLKTS